MNKSIIPHLFLFGAALIYGANYSIAKIILDDDYISPMGLVFFRISAASILFFISHKIYIKEKIKKVDIPNILIVALLGVVVNQSFFIVGLKHTVPINAALIMTIVPILVFTLSAIILKEKISISKILGIFLGFSGVFLILSKIGTMQISTQTAKGDFLILLNATSYSMYLVRVKPLLKKYNSITIMKWMFLFGIIFIAPFSLNDALQANWNLFDGKIWFSFFYVLIFTTFFAYLFNILALRSVNPSVVGIYIYLQPILATLIALVMGKDSLSLLKIISGIMIFVGVYLVSKEKDT